MIVTAKHKVLARHYYAIIGVAVICSLGPLQELRVIVGFVHDVLVHIAYVTMERAAVRSLHQRMGGHNPVGRGVGLKTAGRTTPVLAGNWCGRCVNDDRHKPRCGNLAQEYDENRA